MASRQILVALLVLVAVVSVRGWWKSKCRPRKVMSGYTQWRAKVDFQCDKVYQSISRIHSIHDNCKEDRSWHFTCAYNPAAGHKCAWSQWTNDRDDLLNYHCPHEGFITGVKAEYMSRYRDRRFRFRCCHGEDAKFIRRDCKTTHFKNDWDRELAFEVPQNYYLTGVTSIHNNKKEDRRWQFEYCKKFSTSSCDYKREILEDFQMFEKLEHDGKH